MSAALSTDFWQELGKICPLRQDVSLSDFTTLRVGGRAAHFLEPARPEDFAQALDMLSEEGVAVHLLGGGANLCPPDEDIRGAVIHTGSMRRIFRDGETGLRAWAGVTLPQLLRSASHSGLSGLESLAGVPGQVGGALAMNAGTAQWGIWDAVAEATLWSPDGWLARTPKEVSPQYRRGNLGAQVVLEVLFELTPTEPGLVRAKAEELLRRKNETQPVTLPSAGCAFRNPANDSAGRLIEAAGCKSWEVGDAQISPRHANFLVNRGAATAQDVRTLLARVQDAVRTHSGVELEPELVIWMPERA